MSPWNYIESFCCSSLPYRRDDDAFCKYSLLSFCINRVKFLHVVHCHFGQIMTPLVIIEYHHFVQILMEFVLLDYFHFRYLIIYSTAWQQSNWEHSTFSWQFNKVSWIILILSGQPQPNISKSIIFIIVGKANVCYFSTFLSYYCSSVLVHVAVALCQSSALSASRKKLIGRVDAGAARLHRPRARSCTRVRCS